MRYGRWISTILLLAWLFAVPAAGENPTVTLSGPQEVWARDMVELTVSVHGTNISRVVFTLEWDIRDMEVLGNKPDKLGVWTASQSGYQMAYINHGNGNEQEVVTLQMRVLDPAPGKKITVRLKDVVVTVDGRDISVGDVVWERTVSDVLSDDNYLSELRISDAVLDQEFSPLQQTYTATVESHVASVAVTAVPQEPGARIHVDSPPLEYGKTSVVTVTVTAEDGSERVYTIAVTRKDSPEREPGTNCHLQVITVTDYVLSPAFHPDVTDYVLWLPYETTHVEVNAIAQDTRAEVIVAGSNGLKAGMDNPISITCKAEDGTEKVYTVVAKRAAPHETPSTPETGNQTSLNSTGTVGDGIPSWVFVAVAVIVITGGAVVGILITGRKK